MNLVALPAFTDNYIWMLHDGANALVVDPGEAAPVEAALDAQRLQLAGILVTHHHADHVGGVNALRARLHGPVFVREREINPFLRCDVLDVIEAAAAHGAEDRSGPAVFAALREWKNHFK
jgi:glyoxylase-like metal-dependent hydrolase (beta-lactamase superfamily II)